MNRPTIQKIASDRELWEEYVDPGNNAPGAFDRMTVAEKVQLQRDLWPEDAAENDEEEQK